MMERFKKHCETPITWGAYYKLSGICIGISLVSTIGIFAYNIAKFRKLRESHEVTEDEAE